MEKVKFRRTSRIVGCIDVGLSVTALVSTVVILLALDHPNWFEKDPPPVRQYAQSNGKWISVLNEDFYLDEQNDTRKFLYIFAGVHGLFTVMGLLAGITLIKATSVNESTGRALAMVWFWMYCNIPLILVYLMAGFIFKFIFILVSLRPIYIYIVWKYMDALSQTNPVDVEDVPEKIIIRRKSDSKTRVDLEYNRVPLHPLSRTKVGYSRAIYLYPELHRQRQEEIAKGWSIQINTQPVRNNLRSPACQCLGAGGGITNYSGKGKSTRRASTWD